MTILCSWAMAANSFSHSSSTTAHMATSRVRSLVAPNRDWAELVDVNEDMSSSEAGCCWLSENDMLCVVAMLVVGDPC